MPAVLVDNMVEESDRMQIHEYPYLGCSIVIPNAAIITDQTAFETGSGNPFRRKLPPMPVKWRHWSNSLVAGKDRAPVAGVDPKAGRPV
jgi:hypothetical protein